MKLSIAIIFSALAGNQLVSSYADPKTYRHGKGRKGKRILRPKGKGSPNDEAPPISDGGIETEAIVLDAVLSDDFLSNDVDDEISNDTSHLELICEVFKDFATLVADGSNDDFCDAFSSESFLLCPNSYEKGKICDGVAATAGLSLDVSIEENYCAPLFEEMSYDPDLMQDCVNYCLSYVSVDEEDCCNIECV
mmetsp:Transcript_13131/g.24648  ORF Transcript_13131/g.24648 Transcript_13131/m.24648 type:complete len:193 (-) Transcript_13131:67-645(-)|eukprot:CAMPEP_0178760730 /NCGR_PEP_ID=MMETSP0744-20121128/15647_1 /TAXON_ID=913974 /ORGANISM="Nitzschia punctata, Strain CCMP561" /LENGTH=192 /DNA_ID=CAMNT_0020415325 /DNA_START=531 /DNA_END=1109 /DNA_ORIENTATION=-